MKPRRLLSRLGTYAFVIPFSLLMLFPFLVMLISSLKTNMEIFVPADEFRWFPEDPRWSNFVTLREQVPLIWRYFLNSGIVAGGATLLATLSALPAAYVLARQRFAGRKAFLYVIMVTQMFSPIVIIVGVYKLFAGTLNDHLGGLILVNAAFNLAFAIWLLTGYFSAIPRDVEEAALVDGCNWAEAVWRVLVPMAAPGIVTAVIFVFIAAWNEFIFALTLLSSPEKKPIIVGLFALVGAYEVQWNTIMAGALYAVIPVVILFWIAEKHLVSGLTAGAVK